MALYLFVALVLRATPDYIQIGEKKNKVLYEVAMLVLSLLIAAWLTLACWAYYLQGIDKEVYAGKLPFV